MSTSTEYGLDERSGLASATVTSTNGNDNVTDREASGADEAAADA
ncbi:hypothetical protein [Actinoallomurus rhizosphaericola]|nr:hypothetical protein [Actinoallomurus rhizosphaericola]